MALRLQSYEYSLAALLTMGRDDDGSSSQRAMRRRDGVYRHARAALRSTDVATTRVLCLRNLSQVSALAITSGLSSVLFGTVVFLCSYAVSGFEEPPAGQAGGTDPMSASGRCDEEMSAPPRASLDMESPVGIEACSAAEPLKGESGEGEKAAAKPRSSACVRKMCCSCQCTAETCSGAWRGKGAWKLWAGVHPRA